MVWLSVSTEPEKFRQQNRQQEQPEWKKWDAPYYPHQAKPYEEFMKDKDNWIDDESFWVIEVDGRVLAEEPGL